MPCRGSNTTTEMPFALKASAGVASLVIGRWLHEGLMRARILNFTVFELSGVPKIASHDNNAGQRCVH